MYSAKWLRYLVAACVMTLATVLVPVFARQPDELADFLPYGAGSTRFDNTKLASNQFTQEDDETVVANFLDVPAAFIKATEDDGVELWYEPDNYAIRIRDKASGFIFGSSFADKTVDLPNFNKKFEGIVNSAVVIEYYTYNVETGVYTVIEESMFDSDLTTASYTQLANGFATAIVYGDSGIGLTLAVTLENGDLHLRVDNASITEGETYKLRSVKIYPYFGAVYGDTVTGYLLVPDGSGALVRYREIDAVTDVYQLNYYGTDIGVKADVEGEAELTLPVFGMVHGIRQHAFLGIIEDGAADATLVVNPAKSNLKYYYTHPQFVYRSQYAAPTSKAAAVTGSGAQVIQTEKNSLDIHLVYRFLSGVDADYVGMANSYRDHLVTSGVLTPFAGPSPDAIPLAVELIGGVRTAGFVFDATAVLTDFSQASAILADLRRTVEGPLNVVYKGVLRGGFAGAGPGTSKLERTLGSADELWAEIARMEADGDTLSLYTDPLLIYDTAPHNPYTDVSQRVNQRLLTGSGLTTGTAFAQPLRAIELLERNVATWTAKGCSDYAFGTIGGALYSDFKDGTTDRSETARLFREALEGIAGGVTLYRPYAYLLGATERYLAAPVVSKHYQIYTDTVPFLSIVLAGTMELYGGFLNFAADERLALLKLIDFGLYPSYVLTAASAYLLQDTELGGVYSSSYATWQARIASNQELLNGLLLPAYGSAIVSRRVLAPGFVRVGYANGTLVYVNYAADIMTDGDVEVAAYAARTVIPDA